LTSCLTGNNIYLVHAHMLMRYETNNCLCEWIINTLRGEWGEKQKFFSQSKWHTHYTIMLHRINHHTTLLTRNVEGFHVMTTNSLAATSTYGVAHPSGRRKRKRWPRCEPTWHESSRRDEREEKGIYCEIMPSILTRCCVASACGQSLLKAPASVYRSVNRTPDKHALCNWIHLVTDDVSVEDTDNAVCGVRFGGVCCRTETKAESQIHAHYLALLLHIR
jgi:hypothetical protein